MIRNKFARLVLMVALFVVCLLMAAPAFAQGEDDVIILPAGFDSIIVVIIGIALSLILVGLIFGLIFVLSQAVNRLGVSVPEDAFNRATESIVSTVQRLLSDVEDYTEGTETPIDNLVLQVGRIPIDVLIEEARKRGMAVMQVEPGIEPGDTKRFSVPPQEVRGGNYPYDAPK
jgi:uncharacterized membrane protein